MFRYPYRAGTNRLWAERPIVERARPARRGSAPPACSVLSSRRAFTVDNKHRRNGACPGSSRAIVPSGAESSGPRAEPGLPGWEPRLRLERRREEGGSWGKHGFPHVLELNGAFSNPFDNHKPLLRRLSSLHRQLLDRAAERPQKPRQAPPRASPVLQTITLVLEQTPRPMRATEIHAAAERLAGESLRWTSVKAALAAGAAANPQRFRRVRYGVYEAREGKT